MKPDDQTPDPEKRLEASRRLRGKRKGGTQAEDDGFDRSNPGTLASLADRWEAYLEERNYSPRTLNGHKWSLRNFLIWTNDRSLADPAEITKPILESYQRHLFKHRQTNGQPLAVSTQRNHLGTLQRFFAWLARHNHILANPAADLDLPRKPHRRLPKGLPTDELQTLLAIPDTRDPLGIRDRAILELLYASGTRRRELAKLQLADLDPQARTLHIHEAKGGKQRLVPVGQTALHWLQKYLLKTRPRLALDATEQTLFLTGYGEAFSPGSLGNLVKKMMKQAGINRSGSCHLMRHTAATHMLENGADIRLIQQYLGHAKLDTTSIYTEVAITHLQAVYQKTHPSATGAGESEA